MRENNGLKVLYVSVEVAPLLKLGVGGCGRFPA